MNVSKIEADLADHHAFSKQFRVAFFVLQGHSLDVSPHAGSSAEHTDSDHAILVYRPFIDSNSYIGKLSLQSVTV